MSEKILRKHAVLERIGVKNSTLYEWIKKGSFPKPFALGARAVGWRESVVNAWIEEKAQVAGGQDA
ncbi:MAG: helix-turn-helix transcriptional regulator [Bdellovibrionales bacterium]